MNWPQIFLLLAVLAFLFEGFRVGGLGVIQPKWWASGWRCTSPRWFRRWPARADSGDFRVLLPT